MLRIQGHSDDTVTIVGDLHQDDPDDCDTCAADDVHVEIVIGEVLVIRGFYCAWWNKSGTWAFSVQQAQEDVEIPWAVAIEKAHGYSCSVVVACPPETRIAVRKVRRG
jgi:hypothetical protein